LDFLRSGAAERGQGSESQQATAKFRYRSAFMIYAYNSRRRARPLTPPDRGSEQLSSQFLDDIFHPPA
jgi:hypothetical protein